MLMFIWACVIAQSFFPGGEAWASNSVCRYQAQLRAEIEAPRIAASGALIGAAEHSARVTPTARLAINAVERAIYAR